MIDGESHYQEGQEICNNCESMTDEPLYLFGNHYCSLECVIEAEGGPEQ